MPKTFKKLSSIEKNFHWKSVSAKEGLHSLGCIFVSCFFFHSFSSTIASVWDTIIRFSETPSHNNYFLRSYEQLVLRITWFAVVFRLSWLVNISFSCLVYVSRQMFVPSTQRVILKNKTYFFVSIYTVRDHTYISKKRNWTQMITKAFFQSKWNLYNISWNTDLMWRFTDNLYWAEVHMVNTTRFPKPLVFPIMWVGWCWNSTSSSFKISL